MKYHVREIDGKWFIYDFNDKIFATFDDQEKADNTCHAMNTLMSDWDPKKSIPVLVR